VTTPPVCERWLDPLSDDAPAVLRTCRRHADWRAKEAGDMLLSEEADVLLLLRLWCAPDEALRQSRELIRHDM
jgi:hypothetical protein